MDSTKRPRTWITIAVAVCAAAAGLIFWYQSRPIATSALIRRLPTRGAMLVYVDLEQLRRGGILGALDNAKVAEDPEYQAFARKISFDWKKDLDAVIVAAAPTGNYLFARGRFDWSSIRSYAVSAGGDCKDAVCRAPGSTPERRISFFRAQSRLMALAVSQDASAAQELETMKSGPEPEVPNAPVWVWIPGQLLKSPGTLPPGTRMFVRSMEQAENLVLTLGADGNRIAARLEVRCKDEHDAVEVAGQLASATLTLKQLLERENQKPGPADLAGILASGAFRSEGRQVHGYWSIERAFLESILSGGVS